MRTPTRPPDPEAVILARVYARVLAWDDDERVGQQNGDGERPRAPRRDAQAASPRGDAGQASRAA